MTAVSEGLEGNPDASSPGAGAPGPPDADLVKAARRGDLSAFDSLVKRHQRKATSVAHRLLNNVDDAMEIAQDAFVNAYEKLATLDEPKRFGPWLLRIVSNLALNRRRSRSLRRTASLDAQADGEDSPAMVLPDRRADDPADVASAKDVQRLIGRAMATLPEIQRQALVLFSVEQMPQKDVAEVLGCSVEAVKWHVFTARKKLKEALKDYL